VLVCGARSQPLAVIRRSGFDERLGKENLCANVQAALDRARQVHASAGPAHPVAAVAD
jgi:SulP family sulfate permease